MSIENNVQPQRRIAIITGGNRGLGRNTVLQLAARGVDIIFTYRNNRAEADEVMSAVGDHGSRAIALQLDVADTGAFGGFVQRVEQALAQLGARQFDYLVNNAGTSHHQAFEHVTEDDLDSLYQVHFKGVFFLTQKLLPLLKDGGRIVNISSGLTRIVIPGSVAYAAMKGAVEILTRYQAKELGARGIAVNTVAPGAIATDFSGGMVRDNPELHQRVAGMTALGRVGQPDDIGPMIAALLSDDNRWVTAQRIEVSGGMVI
ncbi:SDR family NAD(P)-dependent oxidoreductase [Janthinobacterium sp. Mn2066]|uniref:SDR family NAD(P)-dependent oxidoreductase n=1 Tax=Janthinobacterium sp. Mn2066 TaxID=3395264 RepID=UPI003BBC05C1